MAIGVFGVRVLLAVVVGEQHDKVRHEIGQRMNAVGNQRRRLSEDAEANFNQRLENINRRADVTGSGF